MCVCHYGGGFASISSSCLSSLEREREGEGGGKEGDEKCCNFCDVVWCLCQRTFLFSILLLWELVRVNNGVDSYIPPTHANVLNAHAMCIIDRLCLCLSAFVWLAASNMPVVEYVGMLTSCNRHVASVVLVMMS